MSDASQSRSLDYIGGIAKALELIGARDRLPRDGMIIIKPNLTNADKLLVTTAVATAEAAYEYCGHHGGAEIAIGEGCGSGATQDAFEGNGCAVTPILVENRGLSTWWPSTRTGSVERPGNCGGRTT